LKEKETEETEATQVKVNHSLSLLFPFHSVPFRLIISEVERRREEGTQWKEQSEWKRGSFLLASFHSHQPLTSFSFFLFRSLCV